MNKFFSMILFFLAISVAQTSAMAPTIKITPLDAKINVDETITYSVTTDNFNHISVEFTVLFDSGKLDFVSYSDINPQLSEFNLNYIPPGDPVFPEGLKVSWLDPNFQPKQLPNGTELFKFTVKAKSPGTTQVTVPCGAPYVCEAIDGNGNVFESFPPTTPANLLITGTVQYDKFTIGISNEICDPGSEICVKVSALKDFTNITLMQMRIEWDVTKLQFKSVKNCNSTIGLNCSNDINFSGSALFLSWFADPNSAPNGFTLPDGSVLYEICFTVISPLGTKVPVIFKDEQFSKNEFSDVNGNISDFNLVDGSVTSGNCGGAPEKITLTGAQVVGSTGSTVCVKITPTNFDSLVNLKFALTWDPAVLTLSNVQNCNSLLGISNCNIGAGPFTVVGGFLRFNWQAMAGQMATGVSIPNNATLFEICFTVIGGAGTSSNVNIGSVSGFTASAQDAALENFDMAFNPGKVTVPGAGSLTLGVTDKDACPGKTICIPVYSNGFNSIESMEFALAWDPALLSNVSIQNCNPSLSLNCNCVGSSNFNCTSGVLVATWFSQSGGSVTLPAGAILFELCFDVVGANGTTSPFNVIPNPNTGVIEFINSNGDNLNVVTVNQNISITNTACTQPCNLTQTNSITNVSCKGGNNGAIAITVGGGTGNYTYTWSSPIPNGTGNNPTNLPDGFYTVTVVDNGNAGCSAVFGPFQVLDGVGFTVSANVTNANCAGSFGGAISLVVTGATGQSYNWNPGAPNSPSINNLAAGTYDVTVTSTNGCTEVLKGIVVGKSQGNFNVIGEVLFPKCFGGNDGGVLTSVSPAGTYTYSWNTNPVQTASSISGLTAGSYTVVVTDSGTGCTKEATFIVQNPSQIDVNIVASNATSSLSNDGALLANATGGSGNYSYKWGTTPEQTTKKAVGLAPGTYFVTITDGNGCTKVVSGVVGVDSNPPLPGVVITNMLFDKYNGYGVSCNGSCDGILIATPPANAVAPFVYVWSSNAKGDVDDIASNLCAGNYGVTITDATGQKYYSANLFNLVAPPALTLQIVTDPDPTPTATAVVGGGVSPYEYKFNENPYTSSNISEVDGYEPVTVIAKDANNCTVVTSVIGPLGRDCNEARLVITPNGDGLNDVFILACANVYNLNKLTIFDRWGKILYQKPGYLNDWGGLDDTGTELPEGGYFWAFEYVNQKGNIDVARGSITIVR